MDLQPHIPKIVVGVGIAVVIGAVLVNYKSSSYDAGQLAPPVISDNDAKFKAEQLYEAMTGVGTDEELIFATLTGLTIADFNKIEKFFGFRYYNTYTGTATGGISKYPLKTWLKEELSTTDYLTLKNNFPTL